ncbi:MAG: hypothetical protein WC528_00145 [Patescibacteria group bacterium]
MTRYTVSKNILSVVNKIILLRNEFFKLADKYKTPFYVYDQKSLDKDIKTFITAFQKHIPDFQPYYALKLNHHPYIIREAVKRGMGLDVASARELNIALKAGTKKIVYYSPAKSYHDLKMALNHADKVRLHIDSFNELKRLGRLANKRKKRIECGVRIHMALQGDWTKYGIPLKSLKDFWKEANRYSFLDLNGIHFHQSRNKTSSYYRDTIRDLASYLKWNFPDDQLGKIKYIDFGGGFESSANEGIIKQSKSGWPKYVIRQASTIEEYAQNIGNAIKKYLAPLINATYLSEPGRYICNGAMHILLSVSDIKEDKNCILNGGVNMVGWQRFKTEYFPIINLSHPSKRERKFKMWGNLCTTWDIWGYYYYGKKLRDKDIIVVPNQGALTYSLAQTFINNIPKVYRLKYTHEKRTKNNTGGY